MIWQLELFHPTSTESIQLQSILQRYLDRVVETPVPPPDGLISAKRNQAGHGEPVWDGIVALAVSLPPQPPGRFPEARFQLIYQPLSQLCEMPYPMLYSDSGGHSQSLG